MPGPNDVSPDSISEVFKEQKEFLQGFSKKVDEMESPLPSMAEMLRNREEGESFEEKHRTLYGLSGYRIPGTSDFVQERTGDIRLLNSRVLDDREMRDSIARRTASGELVSAAFARKSEVEREIAFRSKEESYQKKTSEQEKAAMERNEPIVEVDTAKLKLEAADLQEKLKEDVSEDNIFALGEREYQKQFLAVINDLIKTRASKGRLFGNYKKHIALAEEKYRFYSTEKERIIGKEQAKLLMRKPEYKQELEDRQKADPMPDFDLTKQFTGKEAFMAYQTRWDKLTKALREYKECSSKIYDLKMRMAALKAVGDRELGETAKIVDTADLRQEQLDGVVPTEKEARNRIVIPKHPPKDVEIEKVLRKKYAPGLEMVYGLHSFTEGMSREIDALQFHADASLLCIRHLLNPYGDQNGEISAHAGYVQKHFGVDIMTSEIHEEREIEDLTKLNLRERGHARRVGLESRVPYMEKYGKGIWATSRRDQILRAETGYELQSVTEKINAEHACLGVAEEFRKDKSLGIKTADDKLRMLERCTDMAILTQDAMDGTGVYISDPQAAKEEFQRHMAGIDKIRDSKAAPEAVKDAIIGELGLVDNAFEDICYMMTGGSRAEIFKEKKHEEIFSDTACMPTFERKARLLRDIMSSMLKRSDALDELEREPEHKGIHKKLFDRWLFVNRALNFVDYRVQLMNKGYDTPMDEWAEDKSMVKGFFSDSDYSHMSWSEELKGFIPVKKVKPAGAAVAAAAAADDDDAEADDGEEAGYEVLKKLIRPEHYESVAFKTREQQREAIKRDIWKGLELSSYTAAANAIRVELARNRDQQARARGKEEELKALRTREGELRSDLGHMEDLVARRMAEIDRLADEVLDTVKAPDTLESEMSEALNELYDMVQSDDPLMLGIKDRVLQIMDTAETPDTQSAIGRLKELRDYMEPFYMTETLAFIDKHEKTFKELVSAYDRDTQEHFDVYFDQLDRMKQEATVKTMDLARGRLGTIYKAIFGSPFRAPDPPIYEIMQKTLGMLKIAQSGSKDANAGREAGAKQKQKKVSFSDDVSEIS